MQGALPAPQDRKSSIPAATLRHKGFRRARHQVSESPQANEAVGARRFGDNADALRSSVTGWRMVLFRALNLGCRPVRRRAHCRLVAGVHAADASLPGGDNDLFLLRFYRLDYQRFSTNSADEAIFHQKKLQTDIISEQTSQ